MLPNTVVLETNQLCAVHKEGVTEIWSTDGDTLFWYLLDEEFVDDRHLTNAVKMAFQMYEMGFKRGLKMVDNKVNVLDLIKLIG